MAMKTDENNE